MPRWLFCSHHGDNACQAHLLCWTPHAPSTLCFPPLDFLSSLFTLFTRRPTQSGPIMVQSVIAQVTIRKSSEGRSGAPACPLKMPVLSARAEIKKPISPRATMAHPRMQAGYVEIGISGSGDALLVGESVDWVSAMAARSGVLWLGSVGCVPDAACSLLGRGTSCVHCAPGVTIETSCPERESVLTRR